MGRPGSALDNAVIESWHSTLEFELRAVEHFTTRAQARTRVAAWIDDYNRHRRHSALAMMSPVDYEKTLHAGEAALPCPSFLRHPGSAGARPRPGPTSSALTGLRGLHLDTACAPAATWQLPEAG